MKKLLQTFLPLSLLLISCWGGGGGGPIPPRDFEPGETVKKPVYGENGDISVRSVHSVENLGKIYYQPPFLFLNETGEGIHVIDNSDPAQPEYVKFIKVPLNVDLAMKSNYMYVNHVADLVVLELQSDTVNEIQRLINTFSNRVTNDAYPHSYEGYFICPDPEKGPIKFWLDTAMQQEPDCRIF